jgi:peptide/nickel transport system substrate-binding protein
MSRTSRWRLTALASIALAATTALAGCASGAPASQASSTPTKGGTIEFATDQEPTCLDPAPGGDQPQSLLARAYLDSLVHEKSDGTFEGWLAKSWDISADGLSYTFHLRDDVSFTDGTKFDANAVKANFEYWLNPATQSSTDARYVQDYASTDIPDPYTAVVHLKQPNAALIEVLSQSFLGIQSPTAIARGTTDNCQTPVGSGPFKITKWSKQQSVTLVRNDDYNWAPASADHQGAAYADGIDWTFISEPSTRFGALQSHQVDVIETIPPESFTTAKASSNLTVIDDLRPGGPVGYNLNTTRAPFNDLKVRQAFQFGADIASALSSVYFDAYKRTTGSLSPSTVFYDKQYDKTYSHDPDKANALLDQAGWTTKDSDGIRSKDGKKLTVTLDIDPSVQPAEVSLLEQLQSIEKKVGFDLVINKVDKGTQTQDYASWNYDLARQYWVTNTADVLRLQYSSQFIPLIGGYHSNGSGLNDPNLDSIVNQALQTTDDATRKDLYSQAQKIVSDAAVQLPAYYYPSQYAFDNTRLGGVNVDPAIRRASFYDTWVKQQ